MKIVTVECACISDPLVEVVLFLFKNVKQFVFEEWKNSLKEDKKISDGLNSIKFLKFDQILQQQLYNISFPMIRFRFFGASKTTRKLSKPPKIITMDVFWVKNVDSFEREKLTLDIKDFVFFVEQEIAVHHLDVFESKIFYAINTCALHTFSISLATMDQVLKAVDLIPNLRNLVIRLQVVVNNNDFEILTRKIGNKTNLNEFHISHLNFVNNWEKVCKENFKNLSNLSYISLAGHAPNISINVIDLHDLMTEKNISVSFWGIEDDSFVELPEFKNRFKLQGRNSNQKQLSILKGNRLYHFLPL